jgi:hypothetical protein
MFKSSKLDKKKVQRWDNFGNHHIDRMF